MRFSVVAFIVLVLLSFSACQKEGVPPPTEKDGEQVWHNLFSQNGADHHRIELLSFKVVNGRRDQDHYLLYFEAQQKWLSTGQVEIKKSYYDFRKTDKGWIGPDEHLYPEQCQARIVFEDRVFESYDYRPSQWVQTANIVVQGENLGSIEVSYREAVPGSDKTPFLLEERTLINSIADHIADQVMQRRFHAAIETDPSSQATDEHWRWRYRMAERIAARLDPQRFGVKAFYLIGSTKNAAAGAASDIDLLLHFTGTAAQRQELTLWLEGWSECLAEMNFLRTGYQCGGLLDVHIVTDEDIAEKSGFAIKITAITDRAHELRMKQNQINSREAAAGNAGSKRTNASSGPS